MKSLVELWSIVEPIVREEGLELYDIERVMGSGNSSSRGRGAVVRIYLTNSASAVSSASPNATLNPDKEADASEDASADTGKVDSGDDVVKVRDGVTLDDCTRVSRKLSGLDRFDEIFPENSTLEVSSPGINRKLRREEHFARAVGEHVSVKAHFEDLAREKTVRGVLLRADVTPAQGGEIVLREDGSGAEMKIDLSDVVSARVDFIFA
ncbi:MAG: hypothetical protein KDD60_05245 [Bdellovibrionales bacterium]|nr:hypothetical protein [Bdellovibrionales bacterium]